MKRILRSFVLLAVPVISLVPAFSQQQWDWEYVGRPLGDSTVTSIRVDLSNDSLWYVTGYNGLYVTRDAGKNWVRYLSGITSGFAIDPQNAARLYCSSSAQLYRSDDYGRYWQFLRDFPKSIQSVLASARDGAVYVGISWADTPSENGIFKSTDYGQNWSFYSYGVSSRGLIPWDIEEDKSSGILYVGTEIYNHPSPYHPPFLRSSDGGKTWQDKSSMIPWHVVRIQVDSVSHAAYALTEGPGLYKSTDAGISWRFLSKYFWLELLLDQRHPTRLFGGTHTYANSGGGVFYSTNSGVTFERIGLLEKVVAGLSLNGLSTKLYAACYGSGLYRANVPLTGVDQPTTLPSQCILYQNYPNPFNPTTTIEYDIGGVVASTNVTLAVYDILGREVAVLVEGRKAPGSYEVTFNASALASGLYLYRMSVVPLARPAPPSAERAERDLVPINDRDGTAGSFVQTRKMILVR